MLLEVALLLPLLLYAWHWWARGYWKRKNVFQIDGEFFFGSTGRALFGNVDFFGPFYNGIYKNHKEKKLIGFYNFYEPMLVVTDLDYIKQIFISDFNSFPSAAFKLNKNDRLLKFNPFLYAGEQWKFYRGIHTTVLSQAKLKENLPIFLKSGSSLNKYINENLHGPLKIGDLMKFYLIDNVTSAIFGLEPSAFVDPENGFRKHATYTVFDKKMGQVSLLAVYAPLLSQLLSVLPMRFFSKQTEDFFIDMAGKIYNYRKKSNIMKNDLIEHLIKIKNKQEAEGKKVMDAEEIASHMMTVYVDSVETTSALLSFLFLEIANRPEIQERLRAEILAAGKELEDFDLEKIHSLEFLNMVFNEINRMHPIVPYFTRQCALDTKIGDVEIKKGTTVIIPYDALINDPEYFPDSEKFDPNRFSKENVSQIKGKFFPFGEGPKQCLGMKFATLQMKLATVIVLLKFRLSPMKKMSGYKVPDSVESHIISKPDDNEHILFEKL